MGRSAASASACWISYDNSHGDHERHTARGRDEDYDFPGYSALQNRFCEEVEERHDCPG